eukprot:scaffold1771_cov172-Amphora_coffeaeformis.AAC.10
MFGFNESTKSAERSYCSTVASPSPEGMFCEPFNGDTVERLAKLSERRPYPTKAVSAGIIVGAGAVLSQWIQATSGGIPLVLDWHQIRSFALTGLLFEGPYLHWWYEQLFKLGRYLVDSAGLSSRAMTVAQIAVDETIGVLIFFPAYFFAYELTQSMLLLRGKNIDWHLAACMAQDGLKSHGKSVLPTLYQLYALYQPPKYRLLAHDWKVSYGVS